MNRSIYEKTHEYKVDGKVYPSVTQILKDTGIIDTSWYTEEGSARGVLIHELCTAHDKGIPLAHFAFDYDLDDYTLGCLKAYHDFKKTLKPKWKVIEKHFVSKSHGFAGTPDRIGDIVFDSTLNQYIVDIKTGQPQDWHFVQLAGYWMLTNVRMETIILYLKPNGKWKMDSRYCKYYEDLFMAALKVYRWKAAHA